MNLIQLYLKALNGLILELNMQTDSFFSLVEVERRDENIVFKKMRAAKLGFKLSDFHSIDSDR